MTVIAKRGIKPREPLCRTPRTEWKEAWRAARIIVKSRPQVFSALVRLHGPLWIALFTVQYGRRYPDALNMSLDERVTAYRLIRKAIAEKKL